MKILTLNTWNVEGPWFDRWKLITKGLSHLVPGIIGFQEMFDREWAEKVKDQTEYPHMFFTKEHSGLVIYSHAPFLETDIIELTPSPMEEYGRYAVMAKMESGGRPFYFFNTHLSWKIEDGPSRRKQLEELLNRINQKAGDAEVVVVGDFNAPPEAPEMQWFLQSGRFRDVYAHLNRTNPAYTWDHTNYYVHNCHEYLPNRRIDQILTRGSGPLFAEPKKCEIVFNRAENGVWPSDHFGVLAEF